MLEALSTAIGELAAVTKRSTADTGTYAYRYADLAAVLDVVRPALAAHGLAVVQTVDVGDDVVAVRSTVVHTSGEWLSFPPLSLPVRTASAQAVGSGITYARRYSLLALLGVATDDDDGASATSPPKRTAPRADPTDKQRARATFDRLKTLAGGPIAESVRALAAQQGRKLTLGELGTNPEWRQAVDDLVDALLDEVADPV